MSVMPVLQAIVRHELPARPGLSLGLVTTVTTNEGGGGEHNLEANVRLQGSDLELQRVPVAVGRLGFSTVPRVGDLAVVGFLDGDVNGPVILGFVYDHQNHPPDASADELVYKVPDDGSSKRRAELQLTNGNRLTVTDDKVTVKMGSTALVVESDGKVTIQASGDIELKSDANIMIEAGLDVTVKGGSNVEVAAQAALSLEGSASAKLKGATTTIAGITSFSAG